MNGFHSPDKTILQANLDPMRVSGGFRQDIPDNALSQFSRSLILLQDYRDSQAGLNIDSFGSATHSTIPLFLLPEYLYHSLLYRAPLFGIIADGSDGCMLSESAASLSLVISFLKDFHLATRNRKILEMH